MAGPRVAVLDYGIGNLRSAQKSLERAGADARLTSVEAEVEAADGVVLPGVGAFGACMEAVERTGLDEVARKSVGSGRPFMGICVGMQLLYDKSDESPGRAGLGILKGTVRRLPDTVIWPQMQWNKISVTKEHPLLNSLNGEWFYFVHGFAAEVSSRCIATTNYGDDLAAVVAQDNVSATQFHPEKSAEAGLRLLQNFVRSL